MVSGEMRSQKVQQESRVERPHVLLLGVPAPGHTIPFAAFARLLASNGIKVTYASSGHISEKLQHALGNGSEELGITMGQIVEDALLEPDHPENLLPWFQARSGEEMATLTENYIKSLTPPPCCMITDMFLLFPGTVAQKLQLPRHFLCTMSAATLTFMLTLPKFEDQGLLPVDRTSKSTDFVVPGVGIIPPSDIWEYFSVPIFQPMADCCRQLSEAAAESTILINTSQELEQETFEALQKPDSFDVKVRNILPIGPLLPSFAIEGKTHRMDEISNDVCATDKNLSSDVDEWLDAQPPQSVLYICFGSIFSPDKEQIKELAYGVEASEQRFLWVLRPPESPQIIVSRQSFTDEITNLLPSGFEDRTKGRGLLVNTWAPQLRILAHKATGLFLSHCGWNSTLESIGAATPVLAWPRYMDQWMNSRWVTEKAQSGIVLKNLNNEFERESIERKIRSMLKGDEGHGVRNRIMDLNGLVRRSLSSTGSSKRNLHQYIDSLHALNIQRTESNLYSS